MYLQERSLSVFGGPFLASFSVKWPYVVSIKCLFVVSIKRLPMCALPHFVQYVSMAHSVLNS